VIEFNIVVDGTGEQGNVPPAAAGDDLFSRCEIRLTAIGEFE